MGIGPQQCHAESRTSIGCPVNPQKLQTDFEVVEMGDKLAAVPI